MNKNLKRGFTLIELLVVIAIIGILAAVVIASLNSARSKGSDAAVRANLSNMRAQAELIYDSVTPNSYATVCTAAASMLNAAHTAGASTGAVVVADTTAQAATGSVCRDNDTSWVASVKLHAAGFFCADSTGVAKNVTNVVAASTFICPAS